MRRYALVLTGLMVGLCFLLAIGTATVTASTFTVNSADDTDDGKCDVAHCSLREAINAANANSGSDTIEFKLSKSDPGYQVGVSGTWTISLTTALPNLTDDETTIDGHTQALNEGDTNPDGPEIEITGASLAFVNCLNITSDQNKIRGLVINRCPYDGIQVSSGGDSNVILGNYIGTDATGKVDLGNGSAGVHITGGSQDNVVGGDTTDGRNVISGNNTGVQIDGSGTISNTISGNYIGTDAAGSSDLGNGYNGVSIWSGAQENVVGGDTSGERNVISGNDGTGVSIDGSGTMSNTISGNYIGTDAAGSSSVGNFTGGVYISNGAQGNVVGGDTPEERNVISGNGLHGVRVSFSGTMSNTISGNYIGTDAAGSSDLGNYSGLLISEGAQNNVIGGDTSGERNVISGNDDRGVRILGSGTMSNTISGNYIGIDEAGSSDLGNGSDGVYILDGPQNNLIGGDTPGERNVISGNDDHGVRISGSGTMSNTISGNYIGTDAAGSLDLGNWRGLVIADGAQNNVIGGDTPGERNVISGNDGYGVRITGSGTTSNTISGNYIGTDASGSSDMGNSSDGLLIDSGAQNNVTGGDTVGERNIIAFNDIAGVKVQSATTTGNTITENSIHSNAGLGIDLLSGGNTELTAPTIALADCFSLYSGTAPGNAIVELFTGPDEEGKTYLTTVSADGAGNWSTLGSFTLDTYVTSTATDGAGNTSEFSTQVGAGTCHQVFAPLVMKGY